MLSTVNYFKLVTLLLKCKMDLRPLPNIACITAVLILFDCLFVSLVLRIK